MRVKLIAGSILLFMGILLWGQKGFAEAGSEASALKAELIRAATAGDTSAVRQALDKGADIEAVDSDGRTSLLHAARQRMTGVVRLLVLRGARVDRLDKWGETPLLAGSQQGEIFEFLLAKSADANPTMAFLAAARAGRDDVLEALLGKGIRVNATDREAGDKSEGAHGWTALRWAIQWGRLDTAKLLLSRGADVEAPDKDGETALMHAIQAVNPKVVELLLSKGANPNARRKDSQSVLQVADPKQYFGNSTERRAIYARIQEAGGKE